MTNPTSRGIRSRRHSAPRRRLKSRINATGEGVLKTVLKHSEGFVWSSAPLHAAQYRLRSIQLGVDACAEICEGLFNNDMRGDADPLVGSVSPCTPDCGR